MSYNMIKKVQFKNLVACNIDVLGNVVKTDERERWNARAEGDFIFSKYIKGLSLVVEDKSVEGIVAVGLSRTNNSYDFSPGTLKYGFIVDGDIDLLAIIVDGTEVKRVPGQGISYEIRVNIDKKVEFVKDGDVLFTCADEITFPLFVTQQLYSNFHNGLSVKVANYEEDRTYLTDISPSIGKELGISEQLTFSFSQPLKKDIFSNRNTLFLSDERTGKRLENYSIVENGSSFTLIPASPFEYNTIYKVELTEYILDTENSPIQPKIIRFITEEQPADAITTLGINRNPNDVYYKFKHFMDLLDVDYILENDTMDFFYTPVEKNEISGEYKPVQIYDPVKGVWCDSSPLIHRNNKFLEERFRNQFIQSFDKYISSLEGLDHLSRDQLISLKKIMYKRPTDLNFYKGVETMIEFILSIYASAFDKHIVFVEQDPANNFVYRITTDLDRAYWFENIKPTIHPIGWSELYIQLEPQPTNIIQIQKNEEYIRFIDSPERDTWVSARSNFKEGDRTRDKYWTAMEYIRKMGKTADRDWYSGTKMGYRPNEYHVSLYYDSIELTREIFQQSNRHQFNSYETYGNQYDLSFRQAGLATEYKWVVEKYGRFVSEHFTDLPNWTFHGDKHQPYRVILYLRNTAGLSSDQPLWEKRTIEYNLYKWDPRNIKWLNRERMTYNELNSYHKHGETPNSYVNQLKYLKEKGRYDDTHNVETRVKVRPGGYDVKLWYDSYDAVREFFAIKNKEHLWIREISGTLIHRLGFGLDGIATDYRWDFYRNGRHLPEQTVRTQVGHYFKTIENDRNKSVPLRATVTLEHRDWEKRVFEFPIFKEFHPIKDTKVFFRNFDYFGQHVLSSRYCLNSTKISETVAPMNRKKNTESYYSVDLGYDSEDLENALNNKTMFRKRISNIDSTYKKCKVFYDFTGVATEYYWTIYRLGKRLTTYKTYANSFEFTGETNKVYNIRLTLKNKDWTKDLVYGYAV